jgi:hypothetical protein
MKNTALIGLAVLAPAAACVIVVDEDGNHQGWGGVRGSGVEATQEREVADFSRIQVSGSGDVDVRVGAATSVLVACDDNLIDHVVTRVEGDTLIIGMEEGSYSFRKGPDITITTPGLASLSISGSADTRIEGIENDAFEVSVSGSADVYAAGTTGTLDASVSGSGDLDLRKLTAQEAKVRVSGSGDADVTVVRRIDAQVSGSGDVTYRGDPDQLSTSVSGSGTISRR